MKPTDKKNRNAELMFFFDDGTSLSSKEVHFHDVPLNTIVKIQARFKYFNYVIEKESLPATFKEFVHFRSSGITFVDNGTEILDKRPINTWSLGWTDGRVEYMKEYEFKTGEMLREYESPRNPVDSPSHFHPESGGVVQ